MPATKKKSSSEGADEKKKKAVTKKATKKKTSSTAKSKKIGASVKKKKTVVVDVINDDLDIGTPSSSLDAFLDASTPVLSSGRENVREAEIEEEPIIAGVAGVINNDDLDSQKKFFNEISSERLVNDNIEDDMNGEVKDLLELFDDEDEPAQHKTPRRLNLYSNFVWKFLLIVTLLIVFVGYFSFLKLNIDIVPKNENLNESLLLKVSNNASGIRLLSDPRESVSGQIEEIEVSLTKEFPASGEEFVGEDIAGKVKIINNYSRSQALVASTRLWSPDGKEFRIKDSVTVPAGGEVWVDIYVDKPNRDYAIKPTTFTIPGLWVGLQDKIYAKSENNFVFEQRKEKYVRASDLAAAEQEIRNALANSLEDKIKSRKEILESEKGMKLNYAYIENSLVEISLDAKTNDKKDTFTISANASYHTVFFSKEESEKLAYGKLNLLIPSGKELTAFNPENIIYNLESYNQEDGTATIKTSFTGKMILKNVEEIVNKQDLVGLNESQLNAYLKAQPEIESFDLQFKPGFIKTSPKLVDRIKINLVD